MQDVGLQLYIPPVVDGKPITARVPGFESENINVAGQSPNMSEISPRDFESGPLLYVRGRSARRARRGASARTWRTALFPGGTRVGRTFMMDGAEYTVIGVYAKAKGGFFGENGQDNAVDDSAAHGAEPAIRRSTAS